MLHVLPTKEPLPAIDLLSTECLLAAMDPLPTVDLYHPWPCSPSSDVSMEDLTGQNVHVCYYFFSVFIYFIL